MSDDPRRFDIGGVTVHLNQAPPVYDPGGLVAFLAALPGQRDAETLAEVEAEAARRGAVLMVVQCTVAETAQQALLLRDDYTFASSWYSGPLAARGSCGDGSIRAATAADVPRILEIGDRSGNNMKRSPRSSGRKRRRPAKRSRRSSPVRSRARPTSRLSLELPDK